MSPQFSDAVFQDMLEPSVERYNVPSSVLVELDRMVKFKPTDTLIHAEHQSNRQSCKSVYSAISYDKETGIYTAWTYDANYRELKNPLQADSFIEAKGILNKRHSEQSVPIPDDHSRNESDEQVVDQIVDFLVSDDVISNDTANKFISLYKEIDRLIDDNNPVVLVSREKAVDMTVEFSVDLNKHRTLSWANGCLVDSKSFKTNADMMASISPLNADELLAFSKGDLGYAAEAKYNVGLAYKILEGTSKDIPLYISGAHDTFEDALEIMKKGKDITQRPATYAKKINEIADVIPDAYSLCEKLKSVIDDICEFEDGAFIDIGLVDIDSNRILNSCEYFAEHDSVKNDIDFMADDFFIDDTGDR